MIRRQAGAVRRCDKQGCNIFEVRAIRAPLGNFKFSNKNKAISNFEPSLSLFPVHQNWKSTMGRCSQMKHQLRHKSKRQGLPVYRQTSPAVISSRFPMSLR
jgi:hypothetical protein